MNKREFRLYLFIAIVLLCAFPQSASLQSESAPALTTKKKPAPAPARWRELIGEYGPDTDVLIILEQNGKLGATFKRGEVEPLNEVTRTTFEFAPGTSRAGKRLIFTRGTSRRINGVRFDSRTYERRQIGPEAGSNQLHISPLRPVPLLIKEARAAQPPTETGEFLPADLVELKKLDPSIKLDIRYATTNNLFGTVFYSQPRAFLQRPAAEAVVRIHRGLKKLGYGLLIHDAYRPWYVTKVFWDATPEDKKLFVADPSKGSRHNRGAAVDLSLYHLATGKPVEMVATYDETTDRSYPNYPGGTSLQRWHRDLLRAAMEADGFTVFEAEWWHFDYKDWQKYPIGNQVFEEL
jgi:D-alanyl-D-alanine dipeptidase